MARLGVVSIAIVSMAIGSIAIVSIAIVSMAVDGERHRPPYLDGKWHPISKRRPE